MPGYNAYRKACGLRQLTSWRQRPTEVDKKYWDKLKDVYNTVDDIDLYVGGVGETSVRGGVVGPTFACLIADQVSTVWTVKHGKMPMLKTVISNFDR